jgi:hypothetical protein
MDGIARGVGAGNSRWNAELRCRAVGGSIRRPGLDLDLLGFR